MGYKPRENTRLYYVTSRMNEIREFFLLARKAMEVNGYRHSLDQVLKQIGQKKCMGVSATNEVEMGKVSDVCNIKESLFP